MAKKRRRSVTAAPVQGNDGNNRTYLIIAAVVIGVAGLAYLLFLNLREAPPIPGLVEFPNSSRGHDANVDYEYGDLPPHGGIHDPQWQVCGIYDEPILAKHAIHSMEHGTVWITYQPDLPAEEVDILESAVGSDSFLLLSPWPNLRSPVVMTAWDLQLELESAADERVEDFIEQYRVGPQTLERGATCERAGGGGVGDPHSG